MRVVSNSYPLRNRSRKLFSEAFARGDFRVLEMNRSAGPVEPTSDFCFFGRASEAFAEDYSSLAATSDFGSQRTPANRDG